MKKIPLFQKKRKNVNFHNPIPFVIYEITEKKSYFVLSHSNNYSFTLFACF